ncbi:MAG: hypothetical protein QOH04_1030 [Sphingomonadales bacterium]|jgi:hypothetical protein|nr:hypothetical protein [Sphingomonadales bacterium]
MTILIAGIALFGTGALGGDDPPSNYVGAALAMTSGAATEWLAWKARRYVGRRLDWIA